ncbi:hypothetical protein A2U01_0061700, partial [Trifolium medium]|nr:hypothetical protein [Trifolium medium]
IPGHSAPPQRGGEESAPDGSAHPAKVEDGIDVVDVVVGVSLPVIGSKWGRFLESRRDRCPHDVFVERATACFLVTPFWGMLRRATVGRRGCRAAITVICTTSARGRALLCHEQ